MYCPHCGAALSEGARFCGACGAARQQEDSAPGLLVPRPSPAPAQAANREAAGTRGFGQRLMDLLLIPVAIILVLMGIGHVALGFMGTAVTAQVTGYERQYLMNNDPSSGDSRRYRLDYQFAVNGERYTGSVTRVFEGGSQTRETLRVRYLPFWPHVNAEDGGGGGIVGPVMLGLGVFLLVSGIRGRRRAKPGKGP